MAAHSARLAVAPRVPTPVSEEAPVSEEECDLGGTPRLEIVKLTNRLVPTSLRRDMVAEAAYFRAERRGFAPGHETEDWFAAEEEIDELIARRYGY